MVYSSLCMGLIVNCFVWCMYIDIPEAPPDYFSVVASRIQDARRDSTSFSGFCIKAFRTIFFASKLPLLSAVCLCFYCKSVCYSCCYSGLIHINIYSCCNVGYW